MSPPRVNKLWGTAACKFVHISSLHNAPHVSCSLTFTENRISNCTVLLTSSNDFVTCQSRRPVSPITYYTLSTLAVRRRMYSAALHQTVGAERPSGEYGITPRSNQTRLQQNSFTFCSPSLTNLGSKNSDQHFAL